MAPPSSRRSSLAARTVAVLALAGGLQTRAAGEEGGATTGGSAHTQIFPLPLYATLPNEGSTYGVLPMFMRVNAAGDTQWITAPSVSWNKWAGVNGTFRFYEVENQERTWSLIAAAATNVNRSFRFEYKQAPGARRAFTLEIQALARKNLFYRYFGLGPDTEKSYESSYTRVLALLSVRGGVNVVENFNVGLRAGARADRLERGGISGLPQTFERFPGTPGFGGAALATVELSLRYDDRLLGDYDSRGVASELHLARDVGLTASPSMGRLTWHTRVLVPELSFLTGAARLYWTDESGGGGTPFFYRSALGGDTLFRGFPDDRFIDRGAWEAELEQRIRLFQTHLFHVTADWRVDPFLAVGQVYPRFASLTSHVRPAGGVGLRAFVRPNVLGRVDLAYSSDGFNAYVVLGYPY